MSAASDHSIPGVAITARGARRVGALALVIAAVVAVAWPLGRDDHDPDLMRVQLRTDLVGEGVVPGTGVVLDGVTVGTVDEIEALAAGRQLLTLELSQSGTQGLTDALTVDYAPANLFGISTVALRPAPGGTALRAGAVVDLAGKVTDVTMGSLLRSLTQTSTQVLTPRLAELLRRVSGDLRAFTPMLEAVVMLGGVVADTQRYQPSHLIDQYAAFAAGFGDFSSATVQLLHSVLEIEVFQQDRARYDASVSMIAEQAFPAIGVLGDTARTHLHEYADIFTPLLGAVAGTVRTPELSRVELTELLDRVRRMFADTPAGPALNVEIVLRGMPGVVVPLFGEPVTEQR